MPYWYLSRKRGITMTVTILQALLIGIVYYISSSGFWLFGCITFDTLYRPLVCGTITGLILGHPMEGMLIGAAINLVYIGFVSVANVLPSDPALAGTVGVAVAIASGLDAESALVIAVPVATLGGALSSFMRAVLYSHFSQKAAEKSSQGNISGLYRYNVIIPQICACIILTAVGFAGCYFGSQAISAVVAYIPERVTTAISVAGSLLPCIGFALLLRMIDTKWTIAICFIGFVVAEYLGLPVLVIAAVFTLFAIAIVFGKKDGSDESSTVDEEEQKVAVRESTLDNKTLFKVFIDWAFCAEAGAGYIYAQSMSMVEALSHAMKKWYPDKKELGEEFSKYNSYYTTETVFGNPILGIVLAMEEERYMNKGTDMAPTPEAIVGIRSALMGPFASVGDTLRQGILLPILLSFTIGLAKNGSYLGPVLEVLLWTIALVIVGWLLFKYGYKLGKEAIVKFMANGLMNKILAVAGIVSAGVVGAMICNYIGVSCGISITLSEATADADAVTMNLQTDFFDVIMKGIIPFGFTMGTYQLLKKGLSTTKTLLILFAVGFVLGLAGILA